MIQKYIRILMPSHGSPGALAAEQALLEFANPQTSIFHLVVVPNFWEGMQGDDWLNNASTRDVYAKHIETQLQNEVNENIARVQAAAKTAGFNYESQMIYGDPAECLLKYSEHIKPDLVITGTRRPKGRPGYRSRMLTDEVLRNLGVRHIIVPWPL